MKRITKSHFFIGILSIALGLTVSFVLTPMYSEALEKKADVVRIKKTVEAGNIIKDSDLETVSIGVFNMSDKIIRDKDSLVGKYSKSILYSGMHVPKDAVSDIPLQKNLYLNDLPEDKYAISVTVHTLASGLSGKILQGDVVSVVVKRQDAEGYTICEIPDTLMYMEVLSATEENGEDKSGIAVDEKKEKTNERLATVTLLANKHQVAELSGYEGETVMHLALKCRNNNDEKLKLLVVQDEYFKELEESEYKDIPEETDDNKKNESNKEG